MNNGLLWSKADTCRSSCVNPINTLTAELIIIKSIYWINMISSHLRLISCWRSYNNSVQTCQMIHHELQVTFLLIMIKTVDVRHSMLKSNHVNPTLRLSSFQSLQSFKASFSTTNPVIRTIFPFLDFDLGSAIWYLLNIDLNLLASPSHFIDSKIIVSLWSWYFKFYDQPSPV